MVNTHPSISIIVPLYNKREIIRQTIDSVLNNTFHDFEIIVVDDGSTDGSRDIVEKINDSRIKLISQPNAGQSAARNTGALHAIGEWLLYLDADDFLLPDSLDNLIQNSSDDYDIINGQITIKRKTKEEFRYLVYPVLGKLNNDTFYKNWFLRRFFLRAGSFIVRRSFMKDYQFNENLRRYEDFELFLKWNNARILNIDAIIMAYDTSTISASIASENRAKSDFALYLPFTQNAFWKNCILGELLNESILIYTSMGISLKNKYRKYLRYCGYAKLLRFYCAMSQKIIRFINPKYSLNKAAKEY